MSLVLEKERVFLVDEKFKEELIGLSYNNVTAIQGYYGDSEVRAQIVMKHPVAELEEFEEDSVKYVLVGVKNSTANPLVRLEQETLFDPTFARSFLDSFAQGNYVIKTRYWVNYSGAKWEVDVYGGRLKGLVIAEIEKSSKENVNLDIDDIEIPYFCGEEVSTNYLFRNSQLSRVANISELCLKNRQPR